MTEPHDQDQTRSVGQPEAEVPAVAPGLTDAEIAMLLLEQSWWKYLGVKEARVRSEFDMSITRYYQVLNALIDKPEALAAHPVTVARLRRLRQARRDQRSADRIRDQE